MRGKRKKALGATSDRSILVSRVVLFESSLITPQSPRLAPPPPLPLSESSRGQSSLSSHCRTISFRLPSVEALLPLAREREDGKGARNRQTMGAQAVGSLLTSFSLVQKVGFRAAPIPEPSRAPRGISCGRWFRFYSLMPFAHAFFQVRCFVEVYWGVFNAPLDFRCRRLATLRFGVGGNFFVGSANSRTRSVCCRSLSSCPLRVAAGNVFVSRTSKRKKKMMHGPEFLMCFCNCTFEYCSTTPT